MKNFKFIAKLSIILFVIAFLCSLLLLLCNALTKDKIAQLQAETEAKAQSAVLPEAKEFTKVDVSLMALLSDGSVTSALKGTDENGNDAGYCIKIETSGFGGKISMIVGIDTELNVSGVKITDMSETPGLGAKADDSWLKQYKGKSGNLTVIKSGKAEKSEINAISGATITSKAVTNGVNSALIAATIFSKSEGK